MDTNMYLSNILVPSPGADRPPPKLPFETVDVGNIKGLHVSSSGQDRPTQGPCG